MSHGLIAIGIMTAILATACSGDEPSSPKKLATTSDLSVLPAKGGVPKISRDGQALNQGSDDDDGPAPKLLTGATGSGGQDAAVTKLLTQCGFPSGKFPGPTEVLLQKTMKSLPVTINGSKPIPSSALPFGSSFIVGVFAGKLPPANYTAVVRATATVSATMASAKQSIRANLESFNVSVPGLPVPVPPDTGRADAQQEVQANNSDSTSTGPDDQTRGDLIGGDSPWRGIYCTVTPTQSFTFSKGGFTKTVKFDPPLPGGIWMKADPDRYKEEIGDGKTFSRVTATISNSNDPALPNGTQLYGSATIKPVSGQISQLSLNADIAYEIRTDFGARTGDLGLSPSQTFYVTSSTKDLRAIVIETGSAMLPKLIMAPAQ